MRGFRASPHGADGVLGGGLVEGVVFASLALSVGTEPVSELLAVLSDGPEDLQGLGLK